MKKKIFYLVCSICLVCISCQQEEALYSCDPNVDRWADDNFQEISNMSRANFLRLENDSYKRVAYRTFSIDKQRSFWAEKYRELMNLNWTEEEWKHIEQVYSLVLDEDKSILKKSDVENDDELLEFMYRWEEYARETLRWSKKQIYAICYTVERVINTQGDLELYYNPKNSKLTRSESGSDSGSGFECSCSQKSSYCDIIDHEGPDYASCKTPSGGSCKHIDGCGFFLQFECDGMCLGPYV